MKTYTVTSLAPAVGATTERQVTGAFATGGSIALGGTAKIANAFACLLLTPRGEPSRPEYGTSFMSAVRRGVISNARLLDHYFAIAAREAIRQMQAELTNDDPPDERIVGAKLVGVTYINAQASLLIAVTAASGSTQTLAQTL